MFELITKLSVGIAGGLGSTPSSRLQTLILSENLF